jgi:hypothetical protein
MEMHLTLSLMLSSAQLNQGIFSSNCCAGTMGGAQMLATMQGSGVAWQQDHAYTQYFSARGCRCSLRDSDA